MRPRRNRLGRERCRPRVPAPCRGFNEAEAQSPRKGSSAWPDCRAGARCFNEAEAQSPRKGRAHRADPTSIHRASMWPRRNRLGRDGHVGGLRGRVVSFNEAEAQSPRKGCVGSTPQAMRAGFNEAEAQSPRKGRGRHRHALRDEGASMRPRRNRLGRVAVSAVVPKSSSRLQ